MHQFSLRVRIRETADAAVDSFHRFRREIHAAIDPRARSETVKVDADYGTYYGPRAKRAYRKHPREEA